MGAEVRALLKAAGRGLCALAGVGLVTYAGSALFAFNAASVGFAYILIVLVAATVWGFVEALIASLAATLAYNFYFLPPVGTLTIADPANWVALFSFLATSLIASQLSARVKRRAAEAVARQADLESLYTFSRSLLLMHEQEPVERQLVQKVAEVFGFEAVVLYNRRSGEFFRAGPAEFEGLDEQLRETALQGSTFIDAEGRRVIVAVRLGADPIASLALEGSLKQDSVTQGIANLVAIGLERAGAQEMQHEMEAGRRSEQLRAALIDAMAHEFKTPLTAIRAATTALLAERGQPSEELLRVADEEAERLRELIDDAIDAARLEGPHIDLDRQPADAAHIVRDVAASLKNEFEGREVLIEARGDTRLPLDVRLSKLAFKQIAENARKYSPAGSPIRIAVEGQPDAVTITVADAGPGIPAEELSKVFDRYYRGALWRDRLPGSGLGLSIARSVVAAHGGEIQVESQPGETVFKMRFPRT